MLSWLRRLVARLDRRWIRDPEERDRHTEHVRGRLHGRSVAETESGFDDASDVPAEDRGSR